MSSVTTDKTTRNNSIQEPVAGTSRETSPTDREPAADTRRGTSPTDSNISYSNTSTVTVQSDVVDFDARVKLTRLAKEIVNRFLEKERPKKRKRDRKYDVENVVSFSVGLTGKVYYEVKWEGYPSEQNTHELIKNLLPSLFLLRRFYESNFGKPNKSKIPKIVEQLEAAIDLDSIAKKKGVNALLKNLNYSMDDLSEKNMAAFEKKLGYDIDNTARCIASMSHYTAPDDKELRKIGIQLVTLRVVLVRRRKQLTALKRAEEDLNTAETCRVYLENDADFDAFPTDFTYTTSLIFAENVEWNDDPPLACECNPCDTKSKCCGTLSDYEMMYNERGRLRYFKQWPIYECNKRCKCPPDCRNRVLQHGRKYELTIFKTKSRGWGVKAKTRIPKGAFVCEYMGEVLTVEEIDFRTPSYDKNRDYIFQLDLNDDVKYVVDATKFGNLARFINHSCEPNLRIFGVWVDNLNPSMERLGLFALRDIKANEELSFDYIGRLEGKSNKRFLEKTACLCGTDSCRIWLFTDTSPS